MGRQRITVEKPILVYADTSVYGGMFDEEFTKPSRSFFDRVRAGRFRLVLSTLVRDELEEAATPVRNSFEEVRRLCDIVDVTEEAILLQRAYLEAGIISRDWEADALHVALASVSGCRLLVSWNFKHIVHFEKIPMYNGVHLAKGYGSLGIHSPQEVIEDEGENI